MKAALRALAGALIVSGLAIVNAHGQTPPVPDGPRYVVTYVDVMPSAKGDGAALVRQFRDATRKEPGNLRAEAGRRIGQPNQFVILEAWKDQASFDAHAKAAPAVQFRDKVKPIQDAPLDERLNFVLSVGPLPANLTGAAMLTVTHIDVIPTYRENATALVKQLAEDGRKDDGNRRFEALAQPSRQNHFTVIAVWRNHKALEAHGINARTRAFREQIAPALGALYDERFYKALD